MGKSCCLYPGSFDPITLGHLDIIERAAKLFDEVVVGVLHNPDKRGCFPVEERVQMIEKACAHLPNVRVLSYGGLLATLSKKSGIHTIVRGVRGAADLESEMVMARINHQLNPALETIFLPASSDKGEISASMVRQLASFGADLTPYVPAAICSQVEAAFSNQSSKH